MKYEIHTYLTHKNCHHCLWPLVGEWKGAFLYILAEFKCILMDKSFIKCLIKKLHKVSSNSNGSQETDGLPIKKQVNLAIVSYVFKLCFCNLAI